MPSIAFDASAPAATPAVRALPPSHQTPPLSSPPDPADPPAPQVSRRRWLTGLAAGLAAARGTHAAPLRISRDSDPATLTDRLVDRTTFGATPFEITLASSMGYEGYLERQLAPELLDDSTIESSLASLTTLGMSYQQLRAIATGQVYAELFEATWRRAVGSQRQLFHRMVEFWTDHFNIDINNGEDIYLKPVDERDVIRPHAMGTFGTLLRASTRSPAMLYFLNNNTNTKLAPNENYARELMELHTLGADGGYTQQDVQEVARCFTGWGTTFSGANAGLFRYRDSDHDKGTKTVLGHTIPANRGIEDGEQVIDILLAHPNTARFIATKLARFFLGEDPPSIAIDAAANAYTTTGGNIRAMIRAVLRPLHLAAARPKLKRPFHLLTSALRTIPHTLSGTAVLRSELRSAGHLPFTWTTPDGFPDTISHWAGNLLWRWNQGARLGHSYDGFVLLWTSFFEGATTAQASVDRINASVFAGRMTQATANRLRTYLLPDPPNATRQREALGLAIGAPEFQWLA